MLEFMNLRMLFDPNLNHVKQLHVMCNVKLLFLGSYFCGDIEMVARDSRQSHNNWWLVRVTLVVD